MAVGINPNHLTQEFTRAAASPPPPPPGAKTTPRANRLMGGGAGAPPVGTVAVAICPNPPTQNIPGASPSAGGSVVSELLMSVGAPRAGARVSNTPETTARRPARIRAGQAPATRPGPEPKCKVNAHVVVEWKYLNFWVKPNEPARAVLDRNNRQDFNFYEHVTSRRCCGRTTNLLPTTGSRSPSPRALLPRRLPRRPRRRRERRIT